MSNKSAKFNSTWKENFDWLREVISDVFSARCSICRKTFSVKNRGISQVQQHEKTESHAKTAKEMKKQKTFFTANNHVIVQLKQEFTESEMILKAEVIQAMNVVEKNHSFRSSKGDSARFKSMFPDSNIAQLYSQEETKMKYNIQFGIAPYFKQQRLNDMKDSPFSFRFDETTTAQKKKQYDGYVTYFSSLENVIVTAYCGSLFMGHCLADDLVEHFFEFMRKLDLNVQLLLALGMDGPSVNKSFEQKVKRELDQKHFTTILDVGTCSLHSVNNAFGEGIKRLKSLIDLDEFAIDLHFFFKYSAARREDYKDLVTLTDETTHFVLKHCQTRWLSLDKVLVRIIEQIVNLKAYFLEYLPKQPRFKGKSGVQQTERYQRIRENLTNRFLLPSMSFVVHLADIYKKFIIPLQAEQLKIHVLHTKSMNLVRELMSKFIQRKHIVDEKNRLLVVEELKKALKDTGNHKAC